MPAWAVRGGVQEVVTALKDDRTLVLSTTGNARLADVVMPDAELAQAWLASNLLQRTITVKLGDEDRYGRTLISGDVQERMLHDGAALLFAQGPVPEEWIAAEASARRGERGLWKQEGFVLTPENAAQHFFEFRVVEGAVTRIYQGKRATYINFGERWQEDLSIMIPGRNRRSFGELLEQVGPGTKLRVRGTLHHENGPMIRLTRPEQMEIVR